MSMYIHVINITDNPKEWLVQTKTNKLWDISWCDWLHVLIKLPASITEYTYRYISAFYYPLSIIHESKTAFITKTCSVEA